MVKLKADFLSSQKLLATIFFNRNQSSDTRNHDFGTKSCCENCLQLISAMRGNPPLDKICL